MRPLVVVLPVSRPDFHLAEKWLRWVDCLTDYSPESHRLIVLVAASVLPEEVDRLRAIVGKDRIYHQTLEYERPDLGYAAAANAMFLCALETVERVWPGSPMLWCEADTVPTRPTWITEIEREYTHCGKAFMGAFHHLGHIPHMSGNAVYPPDWRTQAPSLAALPGPNPRQGWDTSCAHQTVPLMHISETIQQVWITPPFTEYNTDKILKKETALFHRTKDGTLIDILAKRMKLKAIPLKAPVTAPTSIMQIDYKPAGAPIVRIMIVTYAKDIPFLRYCLASIKKYASGFSGVTLVIPSHERDLFGWVKGVTVEYFDEPPGKGMVAHMLQICKADVWCPDAEFVLHMDADCMFFRPVTPAAFVKDYRCLSYREHYSKISNQHRHTWATCVEHATGIRPEYDYMVRHPQIHPTGVYRTTREMVEGWTEKPFAEFVLAGQNQFPQQFCEFNTLSTIGRHLYACCYNYVDYNKAADVALIGQDENAFQYVYKRDVDFVVEWWSHGGIERYKVDCEAVIGGRIPAYWVK